MSSTASAQTSPATSVHSGSVTATCSLRVANGILEDQDSLSNTMTTPNTLATIGLISTVCNSTGSALTVSIDPTGTHPSQPNLTESFSLSSGSGAYLTGLPSGFNTGSYTKNNLVNTYSSGNSTIAVRARVSVPSSQNLAAGTYIVKVKATVTP